MTTTALRGEKGGGNSLYRTNFFFPLTTMTVICIGRSFSLASGSRSAGKRGGMRRNFSTSRRHLWLSLSFASSFLKLQTAALYCGDLAKRSYAVPTFIYYSNKPGDCPHWRPLTLLVIPTNKWQKATMWHWSKPESKKLVSIWNNWNKCLWSVFL